MTPGIDVDGLSPASGPVGTQVEISGFTLGQATKVKFNGTLAIITSKSPGLIVTTVPAGATTGRITVTTPSGIAYSPVKFTVT